MYYDWPEENAAYCATNAYMFGNDILTATVSKPVDETTQEAEIDVWFPEGTWYDVSKGELVEAGNGGRMIGAVIPMYPDSVKRLGNPGTDDLVLFCAPGGDVSHTSLYEDGGDNADYAKNFRRTEIRREGSRVREAALSSARARARICSSSRSPRRLPGQR